MVKKLYGINFNKNYITFTVVVVIILLGVYLLHVNYVQKKKSIEKFYIRENFYQTTNSGSKKLNFNKDTLYIYAPQREIVSCGSASELVKSGKVLDNFPIAGLPNFVSSKYNASKGFSASNGLPEPTTVHGKLIDYAISQLTSTDDDKIKYYTTDNNDKDMDPILNDKYYYNKGARDKTGILDDDFIEIMKEFYKYLIACNNNTTVRFIRYYKKDTASTKNGKRHFDEIAEKDLETELKNKNVVIFYENINIINFLQVSNPELYEKYKKYNEKKLDNIFRITFKDLTGITDQS